MPKAVPVTVQLRAVLFSTLKSINVNARPGKPKKVPKQAKRRHQHQQRTSYVQCVMANQASICKRYRETVADQSEALVNHCPVVL